MISGSLPAGLWATWKSDLSPGQNIALVDLFDPRHAKKVLTTFGQAYGTLPEKTNDLSKDQQTFLDQAISGLIQDGKIVSVRLALFAEMVKERSWTPATLRQVGGTEGVGITFLEETFGSPQANPKHRLHQKAAQAVLKALLPETGTDIKGQMRSEAGIAGSIRLCRPSPGLRRPDPHPRHRASADHTHRPGGLTERRSAAQRRAGDTTN